LEEDRKIIFFANKRAHINIKLALQFNSLFGVCFIRNIIQSIVQSRRLYIIYNVEGE